MTLLSDAFFSYIIISSVVYIRINVRPLSKRISLQARKGIGGTSHWSDIEASSCAASIRSLNSKNGADRGTSCMPPSPPQPPRVSFCVGESPPFPPTLIKLTYAFFLALILLFLIYSFVPLSLAAREGHTLVSFTSFTLLPFRIRHANTKKKTNY